MPNESDGFSPRLGKSPRLKSNINNSNEFWEQFMRFTSATFIVTFFCCFSVGFVMAASLKFMYFNRSIQSNSISNNNQNNNINGDDGSTSFTSTLENNEPIAALPTDKQHMNKLSNHFSRMKSQRPTYNFVFGTDCYSFKQNWIDWVAISSFLSIYPLPGLGATLTVLFSCENSTYYPPWAGKLPPHVNFMITPLHRGSYIPLNKPTAMLSWTQSPYFPKDSEMIVVIDPDFIFLHPLAKDFFDLTENESVSNFYSIQNWAWYLNNTCPTCYQNALPLPDTDSFSIGVPYIMHASLLKRLAPRWLNFTKGIRERSSVGWSDEQYAFVLAAVVEKVEMTSRTDLMVSTGNAQVGVAEWRDGTLFNFFHFCQMYELGPSWGFFKRTFRGDMFSCEKEITFPLPVMKTSATTRDSWVAVTISQHLNLAGKRWLALFCPEKVTQSLLFSF